MSDRIHPAAIDATGYVGDGAQYLADDGTWKVVSGGAGGGVASVVAGTGIVVDATDPANPVVSASGGGGTGGGVGNDLRWNVPAGATSIDKFNNGSLNAAWTRVDGTGAAVDNVDWIEGGDVLSVVQKAGDTSGGASHALLRPIGAAMQVGNTFVAGVQLLSGATNYPSVGICLSDGTAHGAGTQVFGAFTFSTVVSDDRAQTWTMTGFNTRTALTSPGVSATRGAFVFIRLVLVAANTWRTDLSADGVGWLKGPTLALTLTPTNVGLSSTTFGQSTTTFLASIQCLRRYSGVS